MVRKHFVMETKGYCLICLKLPPARDKLSEGVAGGNGEESCSSPKVFSLQRVCHYLRLNMRKVFHDVIAVAPTSLPVLENSDLNGVLCAECSQLTEALSEVTLELEILQMTLESCLRRLFERMDSIAKNSKVMEVFRKEMLNNPQTLLHYGIVEQLRKEALEKCHTLLGRMKPRVALKRMNLPKIAKTSTRRNPPRGKLSKTTSSADVPDAPELSESFPVITSVQGSYHKVGNSLSTPSTTNSSSKHATEVESGGLEDIHPNPRTPILNESTEEEQSFPIVGTVAPDAPASLFPKGPDFNPTPQTFSNECSICHKKFRKNFQRVDHERVVHQGIKFQCNLCTERFAYRTSIYRHHRLRHGGSQKQADYRKIQETSHEAQPLKMKSEHKVPIALLLLQPAPTPTTPPPKNITHECRFCRKLFRANSRRLEHEKTVHHGIKLKCSLCPSTFMLGSSLTRHRKRYHNIPTKRRVRASKFSGHQVKSSRQRKDLNFKFGNIERVELPAANPSSRQMEVGKTNKTEPQDPLETSNAITTVTAAAAPPRSSIKERARIPNNDAGPKSKVENVEMEGPSEGAREAVDPLSTVLASDPDPSFLPQPGPALPTPSIQKLSPECRICNKTYRSIGSLLEHERTVHHGIKFQCSYCPASFMLKSSIKKHTMRFHNLTEQKKPLNEGMTVDSTMKKPEEDLVSYLVGAVKPNLGRRRLRPTFQNRTGVNQSTRYFCSLCPSSFTRKFSMKKHRQLFHNKAGQQQPGTSEEGVATSNTPPATKVKILSGSNFPHPGSASASFQSTSKKFECTTCHRLFQTNRARIRHDRSIHQGLCYPCDLCPHAFTLKSNLQRHIKLHCPNRAQVTPSAQKLQPSETLRLQIGSSERIEISDGTDPLSDFLPEDESGAQSQCNPEPVPEPEPRQTFSCQYCHTKFSKMQTLKRHQTNVHGTKETMRRHECEVCGKKFFWKTHLSRHQRTVHDQRPV